MRWASALTALSMNLEDGAQRNEGPGHKASRRRSS